MRTTCLLILIFVFSYSSGIAGNDLSNQDGKVVKGFVYHDRSGSGTYITGKDSPLPGVAVSNGRDIVLTLADGSYELPVGDHNTIFVIKPKNWMVPVDENQIPRFYHIHSPYGATGTMYEGLAATGNVPASADFPLIPRLEPDKFDVLVFGDTQPRNIEEVHYISRDLITGLTGIDAAFGVTLGDVVFDDLNLYGPLTRSIGTIGIPWVSIPGNHDIDFTADNDQDARGAWYRTFGPSYYSFSWGPAHFILLDNVRWIMEEGKGVYKTGLGEAQMEFLQNELSRLEKDQLLVLLTHIPWVGSTQWQDETERLLLFEMLSQFKNSVSLVGHTHRHYHHFIGQEDGFPGNTPHHMISIGAVCGSWWTGAPDEYGIPHAMMSDGTPTSYALLNIDRNRWKLSWRAARRPAGFQMHIDAPDEINAEESAGLNITANIFNALPSANVEVKIGEKGDWIRMERIVKHDPVRIAVAEREKKLENIPWRNLGGAQVSEHLWSVQNGYQLEPGTYLIHIRAQDDWWTHRGRHIIHVK
jgi:hypothetical protein